MKIEYDPPRKKQPVFACFKALIRPFVKKPRVVCLGGEPQEKCLYIANHANKMGPMMYSIFFGVYHVKWGASSMFGTYRERFRYLRDVLYVQKNKSGRRIATFRAFFEAFFSKYVYKGIKILPTYTDARLMRTIKKTVSLLGEGPAVMIFPENSAEGYKDVLTDFFAGFVLVAEKYRQRFGEDIPMRPVYYHKKKRIIAVGEVCTLADFNGAKREEVAEAFRQKVNDLYYRIERGEFDG